MEKTQLMDLEERIDKLLQSGNSSELYNEVQTEEFKETANGMLMIIYNLCLINRTEEYYGYKETILRNISSLSEAEAFYTEFKFYCYRVESCMPSVYIMEFVSFIRRHKISGVALFYMIQGETWRKEHNIFTLARYLKNNQLIAEAIVLLHLAANEYEQNDQFLLELAGYYMEICQWEQANEILCRLSEPSKEVKDIKGKLEEIIDEENKRKMLQ